MINYKLFYFLSFYWSLNIFLRNSIIFARVFEKLTPFISNGRVDTRAIQSVGFPFSLPILTSIGFLVIGRSARALTRLFKYSLH